MLTITKLFFFFPWWKITMYYFSVLIVASESPTSHAFLFLLIKRPCVWVYFVKRRNMIKLTCVYIIELYRSLLSIEPSKIKYCSPQMVYGCDFPIQEEKLHAFPRLDFFYMQSSGSIKLVPCDSRSLGPKQTKDLHVLPNFNGSIKHRKIIITIFHLSSFFFLTLLKLIIYYSITI